MDQYDDLFSNSKDGWIVAKNIDGKIKVALDSPNETSLFNRTRDNWVTLRENSKLSEDETNPVVEKERRLKPPYKNVASKWNLTGFFLVRDLLNFQKPNNLSYVFVVDGIQIKTIAICARITSVELKNNYYRLVVDDGTSAILCMVKKLTQEGALQEEETDSSPSNATVHNSKTLWLLNQLKLHQQKLIGDISTHFDESSLGMPIMIVGNLQQFHGKNYIFAYDVRRVTDEYYVRFMNYIVQIYEYKVNFMFEY